MDNWRIVSLGQVCSIDKVQCSSSNLPYVGMEDIEGGTGKFLGSIEPKTVKSSTFRFTPNHLLYGRLRPYLNKVMLPDFEGHCSSEIFPIAVNNSLERSFLFYWLTEKQTVERINRTSTGARMPRANVKEILKFEFPLPPIAEQKRIVAILDEAFEGIDAAIANTEKNLANARELFESYLNAIFTRKGDDWVEKTVGEIADHSLGKMLDKQKNTGEFKPYLRNLNVRWFEFDLNDLLEMRFEEKEREKYTAIKGDVMICEGGYPGRSAIWEDDEPIYFQKAIHRVRFKNPAHSKWFLYFIYLCDCNGDLREYFTGAGIQHFTGQSLHRFKLPIPPTSQVERLTEKFDELREETQRLEIIYQQKLTSLNELKQSILQKAFSGELTAEVGDAAGLGAKEVIAA